MRTCTRARCPHPSCGLMTLCQILISSCTLRSASFERVSRRACARTRVCVCVCANNKPPPALLQRAAHPSIHRSLLRPRADSVQEPILLHWTTCGHFVINNDTVLDVHIPALRQTCPTCPHVGRPLTLTLSSLVDARLAAAPARPPGLQAFNCTAQRRAPTHHGMPCHHAPSDRC